MRYSLHGRLVPALLLLILLLASCARARLQRSAELDPPIDLAPFQTYSWLGATGEEAVDAGFDEEVHRAVDQGLTALGLRPVAEDADLAVSYRIDIKKEVRNNPPDLFMYAAEEWEYGTLTLELRQAETLDPLWRGAVTEELRRTRVSIGSLAPELRPTSEDRHWRVDTMVAVILGTLRD